MPETTTLANPWIPDPYKLNIELADGQVVNGSGGLSGDEESFLMWTDAETFNTLADVLTVFGDASKTRKITLHYSATEKKSFEGFTVLRDVKIKTNGSAEVRLYKQ